MKSRVIVDTGPAGRAAQSRRLCTCVGGSHPARDCAAHADLRAVLAKATYMTRSLPDARVALIEMNGEGFLSIGMAVADHHSALLAMVRRHDNVPTSLADACLVRLAELNPQSPVLTLDSDFLVHRKNGRQVIEVLMPARG